MKFNSGQMAAIRAEQNSVVLAGAGSGKTTVLAERFCYLVEHKKVAVENLLCLTFTRKAAAEMYERVYHRLRQSASPEARAQLELFDGARISTIDSFCTRILRNWPEPFGLSEDFSFEEKAGKVEDAALQFLIARAGDPGLRELSGIFGFETVWQGLLTPLAEDYFNLAQTRDFREMFARQLAVMEETLASALERFAGLREQILGLEAGKSKRIAAGHERLRGLPGCYLPGDRGPDEWISLFSGLKLVKSGGKSEDLRLFDGYVDEIRGIQETLLAVLGPLSKPQVLEGAAALLQDFQQEYNDLKRGRNKVNFVDVTRLAVRCLLENRSLREYYKNKFRYIMIDEFQDNNHLQKELLFLLAEKKELSLDRVPSAGELEGDKLFFVGDDKQSIYRFRGAEVNVFKELSGELAGPEREPLNLEVNYRSHPGLIDFFNTFFASLMGEVSAAYEADFRPLAPGPGEAGIPAEVVLLYKPFRKEEVSPPFSNDESEAFAVAGFIRRSVEEKRFLVRGGKRPAEYGDFTILMRSTSNQIIYERMFRLLNIPHTSQSMRSLFLEAPVNDIYNLLQLVVYPEDRIAYTAFLRSPFARLSDEAVLDIVAERNPPFTTSRSLSGTDSVRWEQAAALYADVRERAAALSLYQLISYIWYNSGYRYYILRRSDFHNFLEYYDYLVALAGDFDSRRQSLGEFLDFLRSNLGKYEKLDDFEVLKYSSPGVQLMSIHKSKGLEFEIVVLAGCGTMGRNRSGGEPYWISEEYGLTLNLGSRNYFRDMAEEENTAREQAELKRLLYVGMTRAKSHLILSGSHNNRNMNTPHTHLNMLLRNYNFFPTGDRPLPERYRVSAQEIGDLSEEVYNRLRRKGTGPVFGDVKNGYDRAEKINRSCGKQTFSVLELQEWAQGILTPPGEKGVPFPALPVDGILARSEQRRRFGLLVHALLADALQAGSEASPQVPAREAMFPAGERGEIRKAAGELADNFLCGEWGELALSARIREVEFAFLFKYEYREKEFFIRGAVDLFFETDDCVYVFDFKTDRQTEIASYLFQLGLYRLVVGELTHKPVRCLLFPLRGREVIDVSDDLTPEDTLKLLERFLEEEESRLDTQGRRRESHS